MNGAYKAAFIIPAKASKVFDDTGWTFRSAERLPERIMVELAHAMHLSDSTFYLGLEARESGKAKVTAIRDDSGQIEHISLQLRDSTADELRALLVAAGVNDLEVFVPPAH